MTCQDAIFVNTTAQDWQAITAPKLQGAWNLHELLPKDMDFFVSLASIVGTTGNVGQAIYAGTSVSKSNFGNVESIFAVEEYANMYCEYRRSSKNSLGTATD